MSIKKIMMGIYIIGLTTYANGIKKINFNNDINSLELVRVTNKYIDKELNKDNLIKLISEMKNKLSLLGYILNSVDFDSANVNTGIVNLVINIDKINEISIVDENNKRKEEDNKLLTAFGDFKGKNLNIKMLDTGIENLNLRGQNHIMKIIESKNEGYKDIIIIEKDEKSNFFDISIDNNTISDDKFNVNIAYTKTNLAKSNDSIKLTYILELDKKIKNNKNVFDFNIEVPYSNNKFSYNFNLVTHKEEESDKITSKVVNIENNLRFNSILKRDKDMKLELNNELTFFKSNTKINGEDIKILNKNDLILTNELVYSYKNIVLTGVVKNAVKSKSSLKLKFKHTKLFNLSKGVYINLDNNLGLNLSASDYALSNDAVRGFTKFPLKDKFSVFSNNTASLVINKDNKYIDGLSPYFGLDFGFGTKDAVLGMAVGVKYNVGKLKTNFSFETSLISKKNEKKFRYRIAYGF